MSKLQIRLLFIITTPKLVEKAEASLKDNNLHVQYMLHAKGTATSEIMDTLGLGSTDKGILVSMVSQSAVKSVFDNLSDVLKIGVVNSGIAFTVPITATNQLMLKVVEKSQADNIHTCDGEEKTEMSDIKYSMIAAIVNRGYSENVMEAAREAGARGGTVISSRYIADEEMCKEFGLSPEEEKEIVMIVAGGETRLAIMKKISESCGMHSEAKGSVVAFPIEDAIGLHSKARNDE